MSTTTTTTTTTTTPAATAPTATVAATTHAFVSEAVDIAMTNTQKIRAPSTVPDGHSATVKEHNRRRTRYKHVAAQHRQSRPSCLSHEAQETPSFLGFRNLMVLVIIVMNLRLVVENARKYGLLVTLRPTVASADLWTALALYAIAPCHLFVAYVIERVAMENAKAELGRKKKTDTATDPETELEYRQFRRTWWMIAVAHTINATLALGVSTFVVYFAIENPGIGTLCELHAVILWLKTCSYAFTNRDLRHAMVHPSDPTAIVPDIYSRCPYPRNITVSNLCYFWWAPTLVYQPHYPRTSRIRKAFVAKRLLETVGLTVFIYILCVQYAVPVLRNSVDKMAMMDVTSIAERLMKLSTISLICWLAGFFALFQSFLNLLAELLMFGDRVFYEDWWNSVTLKQYWSSWNKPVYHFMKRHVYTPLVGRGWSHFAASSFVFFFSGILHELVIGVPSHRILGVAFLGMVCQLPLIAITEPLAGARGITAKVVGNCIFWVNFVFVGQPLAAMIYFFSYQVKYGNMGQGGHVNGTTPAGV